MHIKSNDMVVPITPEVAAFAAAIEAKLHMEGFANPEEWKKISVRELKQQLADRVRKLLVGDKEEGEFTRCVVVAALSMMLADRAAEFARHKNSVGVSVCPGPVHDGFDRPHMGA